MDIHHNINIRYDFITMDRCKKTHCEKLDIFIWIL